MVFLLFFFLMIRRPPRSTQSRSSAASDVYKRQVDIYLLSTESPSMVIEKSEDLDFYVKYFNKFIELEGLLPSAALFDDDYSSGEEFGAIDLMKDIVRVYNESASARKQEDKNDCNG